MKKKVGLVRIDGDTAVDARLARVDIFQKQAGTRVALLSICAASHGLTLTAASLVVFAELSWNASDLVQAEDRVHRISQTNAVLIKYCLGGPVDKIIWETVRRKLNVTSAAISGESRTLDAEEAEAPAAAPLSSGPPPPSVASFLARRRRRLPACTAALVGPSPVGAVASRRARGDARAAERRSPRSSAASRRRQRAAAAERRRRTSATSARCSARRRLRRAESALTRPKEKAAAAAPTSPTPPTRTSRRTRTRRGSRVALPDDDEEMERDFPCRLLENRDGGGTAQRKVWRRRIGPALPCASSSEVERL